MGLDTSPSFPKENRTQATLQSQRPQSQFLCFILCPRGKRVPLLKMQKKGPH
jgi:hypothetical protein